MSGHLEEAEWAAEQKALSSLVVPEDGLASGDVSLVGGVDLTFLEGSGLASVALVVVSLPSLEVVLEETEVVTVGVPYVPGFLGFRESPGIVALLKKVRDTKPELMPQVLLVDGNGVWHPRGFGVACQVGVLLDIPTVGVAKNLLLVDGIARDSVEVEMRELKRRGQWRRMIGNSGKVLGAVVRNTDHAKKPIFVSVGHRISLETAVDIVQRCSRFRIPEPIRLADHISRAVIKATLKQN